MPGICGSNAQCFNTAGSYHCQCKPGFTNVKGPYIFTAGQGKCQGEFVHCVCVARVVCSEHLRVKGGICLSVSCPSVLTCLHSLSSQTTTNVTIMLTYAETETVPTWSGATTAPAMMDSLTLGMTRKTAQVRVGAGLMPGGNRTHNLLAVRRQW